MKQSRDFFWPSYVDLMTALFLIMLVLFALSYKRFKDKEHERTELIKKLEVQVAEKKKLDEIKKSLEGLEGRYFLYRDDCKRHELKVDVVFPSKSAVLPPGKQDSLFLAGSFLLRQMEKIRTDLDVKYLIVVEGRAAKDIYKAPNHPDNQDGPQVRQLSFNRAMALINFWQQRGLRFPENRFEIVAAGSGFAGACRYTGQQETQNRRFVIQILPKVGRIR